MTSVNQEKSRTYSLIALIMTAFMTTFTGSSMNMSIPAVSADLMAGAVSVGWIMTGYTLASAALALPFGRLADLKGKRPVFLGGLITFSAFSVACMIAWNIHILIFFRLMQGVGASMLFATNNAIIVASYPPERRGHMLGISVSFTYIGLSVGPVAGGILNQHFGWRSIFAITTVYSIANIAVALKFLKEPPAGPPPGVKAGGPVVAGGAVDAAPGNGRPAGTAGATGSTEATAGTAPASRRTGSGSLVKDMDLLGCGLFTASVTLVIYGLTEIMTSTTARLSLAAGAAILAAFILRERRVTTPMLDLRMFTRNRTFSLSNLAAFLNYAASFAVTYLLSIYLQSVQGHSSQTAGMLLVTAPLCQAILSPKAGKLSDKIAPYKLATLGMAITCIGIFRLSRLTAETSLTQVVITLAFIGIGFAIFSSPNTNIVMSSAARQYLSVASSILSTARTLGQAFSMAIVSSVVAVKVGNVTLSQADPATIVMAIRISFTIFTLLCIIGIFCSILRDKQAK